MIIRKFCVGVGVWAALGCAMAAAQHGQAAASAPVIRFTLDFPASDPTHYEISMAADGRGSYSSRYRTEDAGAGTASGSDGAGHGATEVYESEFAAPAASAGRIFDLAKQAHYFSGKVDTGDKHLAFTGTKTLAYEAQGQSTRASYNYSPVAAVDELTDIFQDMSACLEFGRRLEYDFRFQKLAMEEVLKQMEDEVNEGRLKQQAVIAPMLQKIVDDQAAMKVSRARAQRILAKAGK